MNGWQRAGLVVVLAVSAGACSVLFDSDAERPTGGDTADVGDDGNNGNNGDGGQDVGGDADDGQDRVCTAFSLALDASCHFGGLKAAPSGLLLAGRCGDGLGIPVLQLRDPCDGRLLVVMEGSGEQEGRFNDGVELQDGRFVGVGGSAMDTEEVPLITLFGAGQERRRVVTEGILPERGTLVSATIDRDGRVWASGTALEVGANSEPRWLWVALDGAGGVQEHWTFDVASEGGDAHATLLGDRVVGVGRVGAVASAWSYAISCLPEPGETCKHSGDATDSTIPPPNNQNLAPRVLLLADDGAAAVTSGSVTGLEVNSPVSPWVGDFLDTRQQYARLDVDGDAPGGAVTTAIWLDGAALVGGYISGGDDGTRASIRRVEFPLGEGAIEPWGPLDGGGAVLGLARQADHVFVLQTQEGGSTLTKCSLDGADCQ